jgi:hypothetical protein
MADQLSQMSFPAGRGAGGASRRWCNKLFFRVDFREDQVQRKKRLANKEAAGRI